MVQVTFSVEQSKDSTEWFTLILGGQKIGPLEFDQDKSFTLDLVPGASYDIAGNLIGKDKDKVAIFTTIDGIKRRALQFSLQKGMLGTRELPDGKLLGAGIGFFDTPAGA